MGMIFGSTQYLVAGKSAIHKEKTFYKFPAA